MTTASTTLLGLALPVTGELSGTWGDVVNNSLTNLLDTAIAGTTTLSSDADVTLSTTTLSANQARQAVILWTAGGTVTRVITAPAQSKSYVVINATSSSQSIKLVGVGPTTGITIVAGEKCFAAWNGTDFVKVGNTSGAGVFSTVTASSLTSGRVTYASTGGLLADSAALTWDGTTLAATKFSGALNGTVGATTPSTGAFTTLSATGAITSTVTSGEAFKIGSSTAGTGILYMDMFNTSGGLYLGLEGSAGGTLWTGIPAYATGLGARTTGGGISFSANSTAQHMLLTTSGLAVTGTLSATGTLSGGTSGTGYSFSGSAAAGSLTLDSSGNLLVGTTTNPNGIKNRFKGTNGDQLELDNAGNQFTSFYLSNNGTIKVSSYWDNTNSKYQIVPVTNGVYISSGATSWTAVSDERFKDIIEPIENATEKLSGLRTIVGKYKTDEEGIRRSFLIAQDVQAVFPEAIDSTNQDELGLRYQDLIPVLVKAIQELSAKVTALEAK